MTEITTYQDQVSKLVCSKFRMNLMEQTEAGDVEWLCEYARRVALQQPLLCERVFLDDELRYYGIDDLFTAFHQDLEAILRMDQELIDKYVIESE